MYYVVTKNKGLVDWLRSSEHLVCGAVLCFGGDSVRLKCNGITIEEPCRWVESLPLMGVYSNDVLVGEVSLSAAVRARCILVVEAEGEAPVNAESVDDLALVGARLRCYDVLPGGRLLLY